MADDVTTDETVEEAPEVDETSALSDGELIARRTTDTDEGSIDEYVKVFVLPPGPKPTAENGYDHAANKAAAREFAIQNGLHPTGEAEHRSTKKHANGVSWELTYTVPVTPVERTDDPTEPEVVTGGDDAPVNTDGNESTEDTRSETAK